MKEKTRLLFLCLFGLVLFLFSPTFFYAQEVQVQVEATEGLVRQYPSTESKIIKIFPKGTILQAVEKEGEWIKVFLPSEEEQALTFAALIHFLMFPTLSYHG